MNTLQIGGWALRVIEAVDAGQPNEDARVELKAEWIDPRKAARLLAAHANAARGEPILWLVGVDQQRGVVGVRAEELANWYPEVEKHFDPPAPTFTDRNIYIDDKAIVALQFNTDQFPFVVRTGASGEVTREVPWRQGTRTRSVTRADLIRLLAPAQRRPEIEIVDGHASARANIDDGDNVHPGLRWKVYAQVYVIPRGDEPLVIPFHRCSGSATLPGAFLEHPLESLLLTPIRLRGVQNTNLAAEMSDSVLYQAIVPQPTMLDFSGAMVTGDRRAWRNSSDLRVSISLTAIDLDAPIVFHLAFGRGDEGPFPTDEDRDHLRSYSALWWLRPRE